MLPPSAFLFDLVRDRRHGAVPSIRYVVFEKERTMFVGEVKQSPSCAGTGRHEAAETAEAENEAEAAFGPLGDKRPRILLCVKSC